MERLDLGSRKVQLIKGTFFVSLPKTWIKNIGLEKGDRVSVDLRDDGVLEISDLITRNKVGWLDVS
jgi:phosphate uptake regulator